MRCVSCSADFPDGARFCPSCGAPGDSALTRTSAGEHPTSAPHSTPSSLDDARFLPGAMLAGRYRIHGLLGRGGIRAARRRARFADLARAAARPLGGAADPRRSASDGRRGDPLPLAAADVPTCLIRIGLVRVRRLLGDELGALVPGPLARHGVRHTGSQASWANRVGSHLAPCTGR